MAKTKKKENNWVFFKEDNLGNIGLHLPTGKKIEYGFLSSRTMDIYFPVVGAYNKKTGEIKLFNKFFVDKIGKENIKL